MKHTVPKSDETNRLWKRLNSWIVAGLLVTGVIGTAVQDVAAQAEIISFSGKRISEHQFIQSGESVSTKDSLALVAYYHSTNGDDWIDNSGWLKDPVAFWIGVRTVSEVSPGEWRVTAIDMPRDNMTKPGPFPPEIKDLDYVWFWKSDVNLHSGNIPPEMAQMPRLEQMLIRTNVLTGDVPWEDFGKSPTMQEFRVRQNFLTGEMPPMLGGNGTWPVLRRIFLDGNLISGQIPQVHPDLISLNQIYFHNLRLTGPIPDYSHLPAVEFYRIANNNLEAGPIPDFIQNWAETLRRLEVQNSNRTGSIPFWFTSLENLEEFIIGGPMDTIGEGETTFDIPDMSFMPSLIRINFQGGGWTGPIPEWIGQSATIEDVSFINMNITGTIPNNLTDPDRINRIELRGLQLEGGIPAQFQLADGLRELRIIDNPKMTIGQIPNFIGNSMTSLVELQLRNSGVTGTIPDNLANLELNILNLKDNPGLTGVGLPAWMANKRWTMLDLSYTGITLDVIPTWLLTQRNMNRLGLSGLGISGSLPPQFGVGLFTVNLRSIGLADNNFTGGIPASWGNIVRLDSLNLANNNLTGVLPENFANIGRVTPDLHLLQSLTLSGNSGLEGPLPMGFADAEFMRILELEGTNLCIPDDPAILSWIEGIPGYANLSYPARYFSVKSVPVCTTTDIEHFDGVSRLALYSNFPNPFNPSTTIRFELPADAGHVRLAVYNTLGQRVSVLVDQIMPVGQHTVQFDASTLASGMYIYRLEAGSRVLSQTMTLVK
jgi:hypothetical protein